MNNYHRKTILHHLNENCLNLKDPKELLEQTWKDSHQDNPSITKEMVLDFFFFLEKIHCLEWTQNGLDLFPCAIVFSRSPIHSDLEALAVFEMICHHPASLKIFKEKEFYWDSLDPSIQEFLKNSTLCPQGKIHEKFFSVTRRILKEDFSFFSEALNLFYTSFLLEHCDHLTYKNETTPIEPLDHLETILHFIPKKGIPENRDSTKQLQTFFKDTLMHEFDHECPICRINLAHLLIASHIKPFRDCGHIYEAAIHDNGLLLCRNHDYLFDQGFFTFEESGKLLISPKLEDPLRFALSSQYVLDPKWMTKNRRLFLRYHRQHIYQKG